MSDRIELLQDISVFNVAVDDTDVLVDLYGGPSNACGSVRFRFTDMGRQVAAVWALERWERESTPLTLVTSGQRVSLQHDRAIITAQLQQPN